MEQNLPENPYDADNLDDSAYQGLADAAETGARTVVRWAAYKTGVPQKLKKIGLIIIGIFLLFMSAFLLLYGAGDYIKEKASDWWDDFQHRRVGSTEDDFIPYYDQAGAMLDALKEGKVDIGNDMVMLSKEDLIMILEYVQEYNNNLIYCTDPERIRYEVSVREYEEVPDDVATPLHDRDEMAPIPTHIEAKDWSTELRYQTVSYSTLGQNYYNEYTEEDNFDVSWQTITALCEMMAENNYEKFGSNEDGWESANGAGFEHDYSFETSMDGYFLTDAQVKSLCELVSYDFSCYKVSGGKDYVEWTKKLIEDNDVHYDEEEPEYSYGIDLKKEDVKKYSYRKYPDVSFGKDEDQVDYEDLRVPELAPYSISNFYTLITYQYEASDDEQEQGSKQCISMTLTVDAKRFMTMVTAQIPDFTFDHFFELLELLPGTEKEIEKYKTIERLYEKGEEAQERYNNAITSGLDTNITLEEVNAAYQARSILTEGFPSIGVYIGTGAHSQKSTIANFKGYGAVYIGSHMSGGAVVESPRRVPAVYDAWFNVWPEAEIPMACSDGLSLEQVKELCQKTASYGKTAYPEVPYFFRQDETAQALYDWQEENNASITAVLAIIRTEGNMTSGKADRTWNLLNWGSIDFKEKYNGSDYREDTDKFIKALLEQMDLVTDKYINAGQETYFKMQFGPDFDCQIPSQEAYEEAEKSISHAFCPWWDDCAFPFRLGDSEEFMNGKGWCNNCADFRSQLLGSVGITVSSGFVWPVPEYNRISSYYGNREAPTTGASSFHQGVDISAPLGKAIVAVADGEVTEVTYDDYIAKNKAAGTNYRATYTVRIKHDDGLTQSRYLHMEDAPMVGVGDKVVAGQQIAVVGSGGVSTGPHLHIEIKENGKLVDPMNYLEEPKKQTTIGNAKDAAPVVKVPEKKAVLTDDSP